MDFYKYKCPVCNKHPICLRLRGRCPSGRHKNRSHCGASHPGTVLPNHTSALPLLSSRFSASSSSSSCPLPQIFGIACIGTDGAASIERRRSVVARLRLTHRHSTHISSSSDSVVFLFSNVGDGSRCSWYVGAYHSMKLL